MQYMSHERSAKNDQRGIFTAALQRFALCVATVSASFFIAGCGENATTHVVDEGEQSVRMSAKARDEYLNYAIENLNRLEEFYTQNVDVERFTDPDLASAQKSSGSDDTLAAAWADPEMLRQIVDRLNQWIRDQTGVASWKPDPMIEELADQYKKLPQMDRLDELKFGKFDGFALQEAAIARDLSQWIRGDSADELDRASHIFDWIVRNVQLIPDAADQIPQFPWETLVLGRGTAEDRIWAFITLARQQGVDAAVLRWKAEETGEKKRGEYWLIGVLREDKIYVFDPRLGLPIPAPNGVRAAKEGGLTIAPASVDQLAGDDSLLRKLDSAKPYPLRAADLKKFDVLIEASPVLLSKRMASLEPRFTGNRKLILTAAPSSEKERWKACKAVDSAVLWSHPFATIVRRSALSADELGSLRIQFREFFTMPEAPLMRGRLLHLKGKLAGELSATQYYQAARVSREQMNEYLGYKASVAQKQIETQAVQMPEGQRAQWIAGTQQRVSTGLQYEAEMIERGKEDASYWLGAVMYERQKYDAAVDYLYHRTLETHLQTIWQSGAKYNLGRSEEMRGDVDRAATFYESDAQAPDADGRTLRAKWLKDVGVKKQ